RGSRQRPASSGSPRSTAAAATTSRRTPGRTRSSGFPRARSDSRRAAGSTVCGCEAKRPVSPSRKKAPDPEVRHRRAPASDGVPIAYTLWRRPARELLVLAPGFWRVRLNRENLFLGEHFLRRGYDVAALDFRGHGDSGGGYAFGASEHRDFHAVIDELVGP